MFNYEIKINNEVLDTRKSKNAYTHVMVATTENGSSVFSFHKTEKAAAKAAREYTNLVANSAYHAKEFNNATFSVFEITPDMVSA